MSFHALAYIDPGTGSLVLQMILAAIVGTLAFFRGAIFSFLGLFKGSKPKDEVKETAKDEAAPKP
jgi:hypothetical protein